MAESNGFTFASEALAALMANLAKIANGTTQARAIIEALDATDGWPEPIGPQDEPIAGTEMHERADMMLREGLGAFTEGIEMIGVAGLMLTAGRPTDATEQLIEGMSTEEIIDQTQARIDAEAARRAAQLDTTREDDPNAPAGGDWQPEGWDLPSEDSPQH